MEQANILQCVIILPPASELPKKLAKMHIYGSTRTLWVRIWGEGVGRPGICTSNWFSHVILIPAYV